MKEVFKILFFLVLTTAFVNTSDGQTSNQEQDGFSCIKCLGLQDCRIQISNNTEANCGTRTCAIIPPYACLPNPDGTCCPQEEPKNGFCSNGNGVCAGTATCMRYGPFVWCAESYLPNCVRFWSCGKRCSKDS